MTDRKIFFGIACIGVLFAIVLGFLNGGIRKTRIENWRNDAWQYNATALSLISHHTFHDPSSKFFGPFQKGPGYPIFLALIYSVAGPRPLVVEFVQLVLWVATLWLLWRISAFFLVGRYALAPPLMLALYWGAAAYVFDINSDFLAITITLLLVWSFVRFYTDRKMIHVAIQGAALGFLVLLKPVALYLILIYVIGGACIMWPLSKKVWIQLAGIAGIAFVIAGWWALYNYRLLGTTQLASGGLTLMRRADDVTMSAQRLLAFTTASLFGDFVADKIFPGYANAPEPYTAVSGKREVEYYARQLPDKSNETLLQKEQFAHANELISAHPIKFLITSIPYIVRLNIPVNQRGVEMVRTFVGTKDHIPDFLKIIIMVGTRLVWFSFVGTAIYGAYRALRNNWRLSLTLVVLVLYFNGMYALVSHAETRYVVPVLPLYFVFCVYAVELLVRQRASGGKA